jgi:hypothetical protein
MLWQRWSTSMQIVVTDPGSLAVARREVDAELDTIEAAASRFRPDSEINALAASAGRPTPVSELLADLLDAALTAARQTDGDVDPTIGAAVIALGYDRDITALGHTHRVSSSVRIPARWSMITLEDRVVTVPPGVVLDLGATPRRSPRTVAPTAPTTPPVAVCSSTWVVTSPPRGRRLTVAGRYWCTTMPTIRQVRWRFRRGPRWPRRARFAVGGDEVRTSSTTSSTRGRGGRRIRCGAR